MQTFLLYLGFVWLLLQIVSVITPMLHLSPMVNTFFAVLLFAGIPIMLYLSWYFDFTMQGLVAIPVKETGQTPKFGNIRWLVFISIIGLSSYTGYGIFKALEIEYVKGLEGLEQRVIASSIAVLPFLDNSPEQEQDYLAQGVAEEIVSLLGANSSLQVAASASTNTLMEQGLDAISIARRLGVETALTGSVRKQGDQVRVRVELISASSSKVLWSESYDRKFVDIFKLETEIARSTVNTLLEDFIEVGQIKNTSATKSVEAYLIYLKGKEAYRKQTVEGIKEARMLFEQAIGLDSEYTKAYIALADTLALSGEGARDFGILKPEIAKQLAEQSLAKAFVRNSNIAEAFAVQGRVFELGGEQDNALAAYNKAIELNPSLAVAHMWKYALTRDMGDEVSAFDTLQIAIKLDPESVTLQYNMGIELTRRGRLAEAAEVFNILIRNHVESPMGYEGMAGVKFAAGDFSESFRYWREASQLSPDNDDYLYSQISILLNLGLNDEVIKLSDDPNFASNILMNKGEFQKVIENSEFLLAAYPDDPWVKFEAAWNHSLVGDKSKAISLFNIIDSELDNLDKYSVPFCSPAIEIAWAYMQSKLPQKANDIIQRCKIQINQLKKAQIKEVDHIYLGARIAALTNDKSTAITLLETSVNKGFTENWIAKDPLLENIADDPRVKAVFKQIDATLLREREETKALLTDESAV
jgi:TolB-like protein/tetratricopeptide (TPR) repeat protein